MSSLSHYFEEVSRSKLLTRDEERELAQKIEKGDNYARERLVNCNLRLAISIAKMYQNRGCDLEDLIQEANIGLMKAVEKFDWKRGFKFSTYACWWIKQSVTRHLASHSRTIRMPAHASGLSHKLQQMRTEYARIFGGEPTNEELAEVLGVSLGMIETVQTAGRATMSLDAEMPSNDGKGATLKDLIPDLLAQDPGDVLDQEKVKVLVRQAFKELSAREEKIIRLRFGLSEDADVEETCFAVTAAEHDTLHRRAANRRRE